MCLQSLMQLDGALRAPNMLDTAHIAAKVPSSHARQGCHHLVLALYNRDSYEYLTHWHKGHLCFNISEKGQMLVPD